MHHLLYSSNEMYSSTELIRKSKTIFNKIIKEEIDKAIIMRDGKPSFILLDFDKYEKIMAEYDMLKTKYSTHKKTNQKQKKNQDAVDSDLLLKEEEIIESNNITVDKIENKILKAKQPSAQVVPPKPTFVEENVEVNPQEIEETMIAVENQIIVEHEKEVKEGLEVLDNLDFDEEFKKQVEEKVRLKKERELALKKAQEKEIQIEQKKEELKATKAEITEFWS